LITNSLSLFCIETSENPFIINYAHWSLDQKIPYKIIIRIFNLQSLVSIDRI